MFRKTLIALAAASLCSGAWAAVSADEAKQLGNTLTPIGAEKAGNKDGTIPAYSGGLTTPPAGFKKGDGIRPDPFASEKPLYSVDAKNMDKYADRLTEGTKELLKRYPTFRVDVYPTHRSAAIPKFVADNTLKNATQAKTTDGGIGLENAYGGVPFPIPKDGYEVMWNHLTRYVGFTYQFRGKSFTVDASGKPALSTETVNTQQFPYYDPKKTSTDIYYMVRLDYKGPARRAGEALLVHDPLNFVNGNRRAWQYLPGQRRVKLAPDIAYDTPNPVTSGMTTYDDAFMYNGKMDRYDFKLVGKKEMIVPYNDYRLVYNTKMDDVFLPQFVNPDVVRWELSSGVDRRGHAQARQPPHLREAPLLHRRGHVDRRRVGHVRRPRQLLPRRLQLPDAVLRRGGRVRRHQRVLRPDRRHVHGARARRRRPAAFATSIRQQKRNGRPTRSRARAFVDPIR